MLIAILIHDKLWHIAVGIYNKLELIEHIPRVRWCIVSATADTARSSMPCSSMRSSFDRRVWHRRRYNGQQKGTICDARGSYPSI
jgi:hypothetical protein